MNILNHFFPSLNTYRKIINKMPKTYELERFCAQTADVYEKSLKESENKFVPFYKMFPREINLEWYKNLSIETIEKYNQSLRTYLPIINLSQAKLIENYADYLNEGLTNLSKGKPYKFISIGQSPSIFAKILEIKGIDTGICPMSDISKLNVLSIDRILKNSDKYFEYIKKYNVDINNFDKNKNYFFVDYSVTGSSLKCFQKLMEAKNIKGDNIHFVSLTDILKNIKMTAQKQENINEVEQYYLYMQNIKRTFSPIFKLPIERLNDIELFEQNHLGNDPTTACNKLLFYLLNKQNN